MTKEPESTDETQPDSSPGRVPLTIFDMLWGVVPIITAFVPVMIALLVPEDSTMGFLFQPISLIAWVPLFMLIGRTFGARFGGRWK